LDICWLCGNTWPVCEVNRIDPQKCIMRYRHQPFAEGSIPGMPVWRRQ
jgi:hypothetical protein